MLFSCVVATGSTFVSTFISMVSLSVFLSCVTNSSIGGLFNVVVSYQSVVPLSDRPLSMGFFGASMRLASILAQFFMGFLSGADFQWAIHLANSILMAIAVAIAVSLPDVKPKEEFLHSFYIPRGSRSRTSYQEPRSTVSNPVRSSRSLNNPVSARSVDGSRSPREQQHPSQSTLSPRDAERQYASRSTLQEPGKTSSNSSVHSVHGQL